MNIWIDSLIKTANPETKMFTVFAILTLLFFAERNGSVDRVLDWGDQRVAALYSLSFNAS